MMACDHGVLGACPLCREIRRATAAEAELRETAAELERVREQSASWCRAHGAWQRWGTELLRKLGLQPEGGDHGDAPARDIIGARLTEATALLERCLPLAPPGSELRGFIRDWLRGLSRSTAQHPEPTLLERIEAIIRECPELSTMYDRADAFWKIRDLLRSARGAR